MLRTIKPRLRMRSLPSNHSTPVWRPVAPLGGAADTKHHWMVITCDSCNTILEMDPDYEPRDHEAPIRRRFQRATASRKQAGQEKVS
jgi:hypothetical protein